MRPFWCIAPVKAWVFCGALAMKRVAAMVEPRPFDDVSRGHIRTGRV